MTLQKRDNWFKDYQEIPELGMKGQRKGEARYSFYDEEDFRGNTVLDIGCNIGQMSFQAEKWGARRVVGIEYDKEAHLKSLEIKKKLQSNVQFVHDDLDNPFFWNAINDFDVSLFLSVIDTQELKNRYGILSKLDSKTKKCMYFEGHNRQPTGKYIKNLMDYATFKQIVYLGNVEDDRVMLKCTRETIDTDTCAKKIKESKYNKIAIIGKANAGKSVICDRFMKLGGKEGYTILDDLKTPDGSRFVSQHSLPGIDKLILFDYRAIQYVRDFDVIFFITPSEDKLNERRSIDQYLRSPEGCYDNAKEIYTVISR